MAIKHCRQLTCFSLLAIIILLPSSVTSTAVTVPPQLSVETSEVKVRAGDTAVLTCIVDYLGAHKLSWHRSPPEVLLAVEERRIYSDTRMTVERPAIRTWEFRIQNVSRRDAGIYLCVINSRDKPSGRINLIVEEPAKIVSSPDEVVTVDEFETFKLICNATGYPRPRVEWFRVNGESETKISENYGEILLFINVTRDCFGKYRCRASNGIGKPEQRDITVTVLARPVVVVDPESLGREVGGKVKVSCSISGHPITWAGWFVRGELLTNGGAPPSPPPMRRTALSQMGAMGATKRAASARHRIEWVGQSSPYRAVLQLTIDPILDNDYDSYTCAAHDKTYRANASFYLWKKSSAGGVIDPSIGTTTSLRPSSIVIDTGSSDETGYNVAGGSSPASPSSTSFESGGVPPKIKAEGEPPQQGDTGGGGQTEPDGGLSTKPASADSQQRDSAVSFNSYNSCLTSGALLVVAAVFHSWLTAAYNLSSNKLPTPKNNSHNSQSDAVPASLPAASPSFDNTSSLKRRQRRRSLKVITTTKIDE